MKSRVLNSFVSLLFLMGLLVAQPAARVHASTVWTVTSTADGAANPANCPGADCRLRDAIAAAVSGDGVVFGSGVTGTITLTGGELSINQDVSIAGPGAALLTIDGNNNGRIFELYGSTVSISGLTLTHGLANYTLYPPGSSYPAGGAIMNNFNGHLTLDQMVIDHNTVSCGGACNNNGIDGTGGGVASNTGSSLIITNSSITDNSAVLFGGGVFFNSGTVAGDDITLTNVTLAFNQISDPTYGVGGGLALAYAHVATLTNLTLSNNTAVHAGGGLYSSGAPAITITNSTFSSNQAQGTVYPSGGGGIYITGPSVSMLIGNSTFTGNSSAAEGGAIYNNGTSVVVYNSTFTGNSEASLGNGIGGGALTEYNGSLVLANDTFSGNTAASTHGTALFNHFGSVDLQNTILANSVHGSSDCASNAAWNSNVNNLIEINDGINPCTTAAFSADPLLGPLASNGGPTQTLALLSGSPAIDHGSNSVCANVLTVNNKDQRGVTRPIDGDHNGTAICDIGAYEFEDAHTISGNAGVAGATLSYTDGTPQTATSQANGSYSLNVSYNWSGTVTPSHICYTFNPLSHSYVNVTLNQTAQNYTPTIKPGCANINVSVSGTNQGIYGVHQAASTRQAYTGLNNGPVQVTGTNSTNIIASERIAYSPDGGITWPGYSELMGLPVSQLTTTYVMPWYNNVDLNSQLRFGNVGTSATTVTVMVAGVVQGTYPLAPSQSARISYPGLNNGPVVVSSSGGVPIIASERVAYYDGSAWTSFSELMGLPSGQLTTSYVMPWYNNVDLNSQLRFGNVGNSATNVTVTVAGVALGTYPLAVSQSMRISYAGLNNGPVVVSSSGGVPIIASERVAYYNGSAWTSFAELMGLPVGQLTSSYVMPLYDNVAVNSQLRFGNVGASSTNVTVTVGGVLQGTYPLSPSQSQRISYVSLNDGPVVVSSSGGVPIIVSQRVAYYNGSAWTSFAEMMGLPATQLTTSYVMPWYNNVDLNTQLRFGVP